MGESGDIHLILGCPGVFKTLACCRDALRPLGRYRHAISDDRRVLWEAPCFVYMLMRTSLEPDYVRRHRTASTRTEPTARPHCLRFFHLQQTDYRRAVRAAQSPLSRQRQIVSEATLQVVIRRASGKIHQLQGPRLWAPWASSGDDCFTTEIFHPYRAADSQTVISCSHGRSKSSVCTQATGHFLQTNKHLPVSPR